MTIRCAAPERRASRYRLIALLSVPALFSLAACSSLASLTGGSDISSSRMFQPISAVSKSTAKSSVVTNASGSKSVTAIYEPGEAPQVDDEDRLADAKLADVQVALSFVDTDVREFSRVLFSELLHRPYSIDPNLQGTVTLRSGGQVDGLTALTMARQALQSTGSTISLSAGVYRVTSAGSQPNGGQGDTRTFALKNISGSSARDALAPLLQNRAEIVSVSAASLTIRGDQEVAELAKSLLTSIDVNRFKQSSFGLFPLQNGAASEVVDELRALYTGSGVTDETLLPIERLNAVLVVASRPADLEFARTWIGRLDKGRTDERQIAIYEVKNRDAEDLAKLLNGIFEKSNTTTTQSQASPTDAVYKGILPTEQSDEGLRITADSGSNSLVIWALPSEHQLIQQALRRLDTPLQQVFVEATIAEVKLEGELSHGVRWFLQSGSVSGGITDTSDGSVAAEYPGFNFSFKVPQAQVVIHALESYTDVKIVSSPQLTVIDDQTAIIQVGDQVPIVTKSVEDVSSGSAVVANNVTFRDTGVILKVTPDIRSSGEVLLNIEQEVSRVVPTTSSAIDSPTISQRKVTSTVLVPDGTAIVLGGLMSANDEQSGGGLPGVQKTLLGTLFGEQSGKSTRSELIVIIRPVIIRDAGDLKAVVAEIASRLSETPSSLD